MNKEEFNLATGYSNGIMKFDSHLHFKELTDKIPYMTEDELNDLEIENGYVSLRTILKRAYQELESINTDEQYSSFVSRYNDIFIFQDSSIRPKIDIPLIQAIVNRDGIYQTDNYFKRIMGDYILTAKIEEYQTLSNLSPLDLNSKLNSETIDVFKFTENEYNNMNLKISAACSDYLVGSYYYNPSGCSGDRKAFVSAQSYQSTFTDATGTYYTPRVKFRVWGEKRRATFCNWVNYSTQYEYRNASFSIWQWERISMNSTASVSQPKFFSLEIPDVSINDGSLGYTWDVSIGDWRFNENYATSYFTEVYIEGKSQGIGNNWIIVSCP